MTALRWVRIGVVAVLLSACAGAPVALGTRAAEGKGAGPGRAITAEACGFQLLLFIPVGVNDRLERAYGSLQVQAAGDIISDVRVKERWGWRVIGTSYCTTLEAKAFKRNA